MTTAEVNALQQKILLCRRQSFLDELAVLGASAIFMGETAILQQINVTGVGGGPFVIDCNNLQVRVFTGRELKLWKRRQAYHRKKT